MKRSTDSHHDTCCISVSIFLPTIPFSLLSFFLSPERVPVYQKETEGCHVIAFPTPHPHPSPSPLGVSLVVSQTPTCVACRPAWRQAGHFPKVLLLQLGFAPATNQTKPKRTGLHRDYSLRQHSAASDARLWLAIDWSDIKHSVSRACQVSCDLVSL